MKTFNHGRFNEQLNRLNEAYQKPKNAYELGFHDALTRLTKEYVADWQDKEETEDED